MDDTSFVKKGDDERVSESSNSTIVVRQDLHPRSEPSPTEYLVITKRRNRIDCQVKPKKDITISLSYSFSVLSDSLFYCAASLLLDVLLETVLQSPKSLGSLLLWRQQKRTFLPFTYLNYPRLLPPNNLNKIVVAWGLPNHGQTCFLNSVLQALSALPGFIYYLDTMIQWYSVDQTATFTHILAQTLLHINCNDQCSPKTRKKQLFYCTSRILRIISSKYTQFSSGPFIHSSWTFLQQHSEQQDAQEFFQAMLDLIQTETRFIVSSTPFLTHESIWNITSLHSDERSQVHPITRIQNINMYQINSEKSYDHALTESTNPVDRNLEEKKLEDGEGHGGTIPQCFHPEAKISFYTTTTTTTDTNIYSHFLFKSLSSSCSTPMTGWMSSLMQCCVCHHTRPLQNTVFFHVTIVPTSISHRATQSSIISSTAHNNSCLLEHCLDDFSKPERIQNVPCPSCSIQYEIKSTHRELRLLQGTLEYSSKKKWNEIENHALALQKEYDFLQKRLKFLQSLDPDKTVFADRVENDNVDRTTHSIPKPFFSDHVKCLYISRPPPILCIHINRLYYEISLNTMTKCKQHVLFSDILDLNETQVARAYWGSLKNAMPYKLMSVIEHRGNAMAGHYVTYKRLATESEEWALISDECVSNVSFENVRRCQAYMLFYERMLK